MPSFLITGITSIHGWPIFTHFQKRYPNCVLGVKTTFARQPVESSSVVAANIEDGASLHAICERFQPSHIIHCAGHCDLDAAEAYPERAYLLNEQGALHIARESHGARVIYVSYDLVFSGKAQSGLGYRESDTPDPLTVVGKSIVAAEKVVGEIPDSLIVRLGLPMGASVQGNKGAVDWISSRFQKNQRVTLLYDEIRSTIRTEDLGPALDALVHEGCTGILNLGSPQSMSLYGMGERLLQRGNYPGDLLEGKFRYQFPPSPPRMGNVSLDSSKAYALLGWVPQPWEEQ